ncbi:MAG TPA: hypothetical protein VGF45_22895 [Polyangia bacterium]
MRSQKHFWGARASRSMTAACLLALATVAACDDDETPPGPPADAARDTPVADAGAPDGNRQDTLPNLDAGDAPRADAADGGAVDGGGSDGGGDAGDGGSDTSAPPPADNDMAVVRFNANGTIDTTFGTNGIARVDLGVGAGTTRDSLYSVTRDATNRIVLFGSKKADGRSDSDRVVVRLTPAGANDTTFGTMGSNVLNINNLGDNARTGIVQADGKIVSSGYTNQPTGAGTQTANKIVLLRLLDNGMPDTTFGMDGVVNALPFAPNPTTGLFGMVEAYAVGRQSTGAYVTTGYGRVAAMGTVDMVSFRFGPNGAVDNTWGTSGAAVLDLVGENDRGRNLVVLPDDRVFITGSGSPAANSIDAMAMFLTPMGARDTTFNTTGYKLYDFERADEAFFGAAVAPTGNWVAAAGYRTGGNQDDDATLLLLPLAGAAGGVEFAKAVPLSETENDRFWDVAFDASGKVLAAGFVRAGGDNWMAVARFNTDGTLDATFGTAGVAKVNVSVAGTDETARGLVVQSDGKIVIAGNVEAVK